MSLDRNYAPTRRGERETTKFFTIGDVAEQLGVSIRTVRRWIKAGDLVAHRFRGIVRIAKDDLENFLEAHRAKAP